MSSGTLGLPNTYAQDHDFASPPRETLMTNRFDIRR